MRPVTRASARSTLFAIGGLTGFAVLAAEPLPDTPYRLVEGRGYTVCEAFLKNLNAFNEPMVCDLKVHPSHSEFSSLEWEELDVQSNLKLVYEAESLLVLLTPTGTKPKPFEEWAKDFHARVASSKTNAPRLRRAILDLNGSGPETLIWYEQPGTESCRDSVAQLRHASSLVTFGGDIFVQRRKSQQLERITGLTGRTEVVLYKGRSPWFVHAYMGPAWRQERSKRVAAVWLKPISSRFTSRDRYLAAPRCEYERDLI